MFTLTIKDPTQALSKSMNLLYTISHLSYALEPRAPKFFFFILYIENVFILQVK